MLREPYYADEHVMLYHGDCREIDAWRGADILVTDPPYGRDWKQGAGLLSGHGGSHSPAGHRGIANDRDTTVRDTALAAWGDRPAVVFGDPLITPPQAARQALVYAKQSDSGVRGALAGFRRDVEMIYLVGKWGAGIGGESSVLRATGLMAGEHGLAARSGHPHAKSTAVLEVLIQRCPSGMIADPFAGSGSTLIAARNLGRRAIGVEIDERYCEAAAKRLSQSVLDLGVPTEEADRG
ncbi:DNA methyltransferase [Nocardia sp. NPDC058640]|uniref:DNA methyltransferase n=1 Tax=Nocardia sp. NPDC058640 TaxID=3346571 RepID=UPI003654B2E6